MRRHQLVLLKRRYAYIIINLNWK